jgi:hypothetical protein
MPWEKSHRATLMPARIIGSHTGGDATAMGGGMCAGFTEFSYLAGTVLPKPVAASPRP